MATLLLLRHAQAATVSIDGDSARPLNDRGRRDAETLGAWLRAADLRPDDVYCSPACRARETWQCVATRLAVTPRVAVESLIYDAGADAMLSLIASSPPDSDCVMLIGHNPTLHQVAFMLTGSGNAAVIDRLTTGFPPCTLAELQFADGWSAVRPGTGSLTRFVTPQDLEGMIET